MGFTDRSESNTAPADADVENIFEDALDADANAPCRGEGCVATSCASGDGGAGTGNTCGPDASSDCCESIPLAQDGGVVFLHGPSAAPTPVGPFRLDRFEVTVGRMRVFVESAASQNPPAEGAGRHPRIPFSGWDSKWNTNLRLGDKALNQAFTSCAQNFGSWTAEDRRSAITCVDWFTAFAFCVWDGGRLPTEAEWLYAATGGSANWTTPYSEDELDAGVEGGALANYCQSGILRNEAGLPTIQNFSCTDTTSIFPVGRLGLTGPFGHADLGGNAFEHVLDWFVAPRPAPCAEECAQVVQGSVTDRTIRGGSFRFSEYSVRNANRDQRKPGLAEESTGLRCARD